MENTMDMEYYTEKIEKSSSTRENSRMEKK